METPETELALPIVKTTESVGTAVRLAITSSAIFSVMFAFIKLLGQSYPSGEILFCRSFFALIPLAPIIARQGGIEVFKTKRPMLHLTRSAMGLLSAFLCIEALQMLPLSEATSFFFTAPLITTVLSFFMLSEKISPTKLLGVLIGFGGVVYMLQPHVDGNLTGAFIALGSAVGASFVAIELRKMGTTEKSATIVIYFMLACTLAGLITMLFKFTMPTLQDAILLVAIGITGGIAQIYMTESYKHAPASTIAPLNYVSLIWATILDTTLFAKTPHMFTIVGAVIVAASGILVVRAGQGEKPAKTALSHDKKSVTDKEEQVEPIAS
ncbi:MAG: DMT family transporter [Candidatus Obscuribacter sp.]|jgi:drug/metabolite transporter (DMT)-like permease|nr:DMT family transporter [Candidatus Obscuribacter sp.]MDQ5964095.1 family transporter [Cyanobacteriota bacterium erpe_2018_sw_39hr_WHONDRS-SW48-000098_B_bin.30]MBK9622746.1 DMT family transporter [Candidatus Obscuribacter sp.]MBL0188941.1 DMT family transporter [Candidatus Obscuribacter sp.]MBP6349714.1 DMT family transporter [Candidatus Obscuribacter sp.]